MASVTARSSQKTRPTPAGSLGSCARGWLVTWPPPDPKIRAISPADLRPWTPRLARDNSAVPPSSSRSRPPLSVAAGTAAAALARRLGCPVRAGPGAVAPGAAGAHAGIEHCRHAGAAALKAPLENTCDTPCTAWNTTRASAAYRAATSIIPGRIGQGHQPGRNPALRPGRHCDARALARPAPPLWPGGGSIYVSSPRVNFGERRRARR